MIRHQEQIQHALDDLRAQVAADFLALAIPEPDGQMRWQYASGNRNDRFKRIFLRPGKGIAGRVVSLGRPVAVEGMTPKAGDDPRDYPILLAEGLCCAVGVPVLRGERVHGVLLVANRSERIFADADVDALLGLAEQLGSVYSER
ncbi:GAF domain-containing protein [Tumebacillus permanentifrigoris]|uniref:Nitrogen regulatory protein A n=1 Tax=Tumebacillus permanentifrigoris TaxID=378543 RepID=A0A316DDS5_9BACL|nr:GAF domain-containing protein [Tumebacillus permanentifrigoris]PWK15672.1 nitrogen regulatory protein A [Tumebacillus permanentifrigoris]